MNDIKNLKEILSQNNVYNNESRYIEFDRTWCSASQLKEISEIIYHNLKKLQQKYLLPWDFSNMILILPDPIGGNLGILPVGFYLAELLSCPTCIWKEFANINLGTPKLFGCKIRG